MFSPLTTVLVKIFARGFYRVHSGLLLFSFVSLITYCFFIEVLNQTHISHDQVIEYNLILVLTLITSPDMLSLVFVIWFVLTVKCWQYISAQTLLPSNQFLFYSCTSIHKVNQFRSWFIVQMTISLPMLGYGLFSLLIGIIYGYYVIPVIILLYVLLLSLFSAYVYVRRINKRIDFTQNLVFLKWVRNWNKPFFSLFLYHGLNRLKISLLVTKLLSYGMMTVGFYLLSDIDHDLQRAGVITLGIVIIHAILIYQSYQFEDSYLSFSRNFPRSKRRMYFDWTLAYALLTLPENIWLSIEFPFPIGMTMVVLNIGTGMLFRSLLYVTGPDMRKYMYCIFFLFCLSFAIILWNGVWLLTLLNVVISFIIFDRYYYSPTTLMKT